MNRAAKNKADRERLARKRAEAKLPVEAREALTKEATEFERLAALDPASMITRDFKGAITGLSPDGLNYLDLCAIAGWANIDIVASKFRITLADLQTLLKNRDVEVVFQHGKGVALERNTLLIEGHAATKWPAALFIAKAMFGLRDTSAPQINITQNNSTNNQANVFATMGQTPTELWWIFNSIMNDSVCGAPVHLGAGTSDRCFSDETIQRCIDEFGAYYARHKDDMSDGQSLVSQYRDTHPAALPTAPLGLPYTPPRGIGQQARLLDDLPPPAEAKPKAPPYISIARADAIDAEFEEVEPLTYDAEGFNKFGYRKSGYDRFGSHVSHSRQAKADNRKIPISDEIEALALAEWEMVNDIERSPSLPPLKRRKKLPSV